jgi:hypothetical protein
VRRYRRRQPARCISGGHDALDPPVWIGEYGQRRVNAPNPGWPAGFFLELSARRAQGRLEWVRGLGYSSAPIQGGGCQLSGVKAADT